MCFTALAFKKTMKGSIAKFNVNFKVLWNGCTLVMMLMVVTKCDFVALHNLNTKIVNNNIFIKKCLCYDTSSMFNASQHEI